MNTNMEAWPACAVIGIYVMDIIWSKFLLPEKSNKIKLFSNQSLFSRSVTTALVMKRGSEFVLVTWIIQP